MNQRFQNAEIKLVSEQYAENELYRAVCTIGPQLENELKEFGLSPEECFTETLEQLSVIAEKGEDVLPEIDNLWLAKENEYRRFDRHVSEDEIRKAVGIVFGFVILAIDSSQHSFYRYTLSEQLTMLIARHKWDGWQETLGRIFDVPLSDGWFDAYINEELEEKREADAERGEPGAKITKFSDFIINKTEIKWVTDVIKQNIASSSPKQVALVIIGGIEAGKIGLDVSAPSIAREFGVNGNSIKPHLTHYKSYRNGMGNYFSEEELSPYKSLYCKK